MKMKNDSIKQWTGNRVEDEGAIQISESLKTNTTLIELNLSGDDKDNSFLSTWWNEIQIQ